MSTHIETFEAFEFKINGVVIPTPTSYTIGFEPMSDGERGLSGDLDLKGVAAKYVVTCFYSSIYKSEMKIIMGQTWDLFKENKDKIIVTATFPDYDDTYVTEQMYFAPMNATRTNASTKNGKWENFTFKLIQI